MKRGKMRFPLDIQLFAEPAPGTTPPGPGETGPTTPPKGPTVPPAGGKPVVKDPNRLFKRDEVTKIVKARQDRFSLGLCKKYGVSTLKELDDLYNKHKDYDAVVTERDNLKTSNATMSEELAFLSNGIDPERYEDVRTYFKGLGTAFDKAILKEHLEKHPEWVKKEPAPAPAPTVPPTTTPRKIGTPQKGPVPESELEAAQEIYGMKFVK